MNHFLLIGGGIGQLHLARKIKARGDVLTVMAYHFLPEIEQIADQTVQQDLFDLQGAVKAASIIKPDAVVSDQHDLYIPTVAYIAEHLGLPGNKYEQVMTYCDKNRFRDTCELVGVPVPKHRRVIDDSLCEIEGLSFPLMIKPADAQSSLGITKVYNKDEYTTAVEKAISFSRSHTAIVEEFFEGREIVSEGLIVEGKYYNLSFGDRRYFDLKDGFIPSQTLFPSDIPQSLSMDFCKYETLIANHVKPYFAIVHSEWLWDTKSNRVVCVESALRGGGVFISSHIIPLSTGLDINDLLLSYSLGNRICIDDFFKNRVDESAGYICFYLPDGVVNQIRGKDELESLDEVALIRLDNIHVGDKTEIMTHKGQRMGPLILHAKSRAEMESIITQVQHVLQIDVMGPDGQIRGPRWN